MKIVKMDKKWRIILPKNIRRSAALKQSQGFSLRLENDTIILKKIHDKKESANDMLMKDIMNPAVTDKKRIKYMDLEKLEEEAWLP